MWTLLSGERRVLCWRAVDVKEYGADVGGAWDWMFHTLAAGTFRVWADKHLVAIHLRAGETFWLPFGWQAATLTDADVREASQLVIQPWLNVRMAARSHGIMLVVDAQLDFLQRVTAAASGHSAWKSIEKDYTKWLERVATAAAALGQDTDEAERTRTLTRQLSDPVKREVKKERGRLAIEDQAGAGAAAAVRPEEGTELATQELEAQLAAAITAGGAASSSTGANAASAADAGVAAAAADAEGGATPSAAADQERDADASPVPEVPDDLDDAAAVAAFQEQEEPAPTASDAERETDAFRRAAEDVADLD